MPRPLDYFRPDASEPRPPLVLVINAVAWMTLLLAFLVGATWGLGDLGAEGAVGVALAIGIWVPGLGVGLLLWASVFRGSRTATGILTALLFAGTGMLVIAAIGNAGELIVAGDVWLGLGAGVIALAVAAYFLCMALLSLRWLRQLSKQDQSVFKDQ